MLEALIPAVLEQRVYGKDARRAWRSLVTKFGAPAPGPAPAHMRVPPPGEVWRRIPSWEFHRANVDPGRARTIVGCAQRADSLERLATGHPEQARAALMSLPGVGEWTAAETAQRAFGDADALSVGDYHLAAMIGWRLLGQPIDDPAMVELLEPLRPHRHRAVRLLEVTGPAILREEQRGRRYRTCARSSRPARLPPQSGGTRRGTVDHAKELRMAEFTIPGMSEKDGNEVADMLQKALSTYNDLHLTLKHVHWNVVGPNFIGVHEMIDPQVELVRGYADEVAERIAALGKSPQGTPGAIIKDRTWDDYSVDRDTVQAHLAALDLVYTGVIEDTRKCIDRLEDLDLVSQDIFIDHAARAGEVPVVRARPPGERRRAAGQPGRADRARRRQQGQEEGAGQVVAVLQGVVAIEERDVNSDLGVVQPPRFHG